MTDTGVKKKRISKAIVSNGKLEKYSFQWESKKKCYFTFLLQWQLLEIQIIYSPASTAKECEQVNAL